jgi:hypothetical protein
VETNAKNVQNIQILNNVIMLALLELSLLEKIVFQFAHNKIKYFLMAAVYVQVVLIKLMVNVQNAKKVLNMIILLKLVFPFVQLIQFLYLKPKHVNAMMVIICCMVAVINVQLIKFLIILGVVICPAHKIMYSMEKIVSANLAFINYQVVVVNVKKIKCMIQQKKHAFQDVLIMKFGKPIHAIVYQATTD